MKLIQEISSKRLFSYFVSFSKAPIWKWQREYFKTRQIDAWREGDVPHYVSSNPAMAESYAKLILAFFRDSILKHKTNDPFYIIELGSGSGRFSYHLLKALDSWRENPLFSQINFKYVITDFVKENLEFWKSHSRLQSYISEGVLDFAIFDAENDEEFVLEISKESLKKGKINQPIIVIANYFFDSLPQDLYHFKQGKIKEVRVNSDESKVPKDATAKDKLKDVKLEYSYYSIDKVQNELLTPLLEYYAQNLNESHVLIPTIGLRCMERLKVLSNEGVFLISADKSLIYLSDWEAKVEPFIAKHGSISLSVNYHAFKLHCEGQSGISYLPLNKPSHITIGAFLYLKEAKSYIETKLAYEKYVQDFSADDYYILKKHIHQTMGTLSISGFFGSMRLSGYDSRLFFQLLPRVYQLKEEFNENDRFSFLQLVARVWDGYYPLGEDRDLAFDIALILLDLDFPKESLSFLNLSETIYGTNEKLYLPRALSLHLIGNHKEAKELLHTLLIINPKDENVKILLNQIQNFI